MIDSAGELLRTCIVIIVFASSTGWALSIVDHWDVWRDDLRAKLVSLAILPILVLNGLGIVYAATKGYPVTWVTFGFAVTYALLNLAMYVPLPKPAHPQRRASDRLR